MKKTIFTIFTFASLFFALESQAQCAANVQISADVNGVVTFTDQSSAQSAMTDVSTTLTLRRAYLGSQQFPFSDTVALWPNSGTADVQFPTNHVYEYYYQLFDSLNGCSDVQMGKLNVFNAPSTCTGGVTHVESEGVAYLIDQSTNTTSSTQGVVQIEFPSNPANTSGAVLGTMNLSGVPQISEYGFSVPGTYTYTYIITDFQNCSQLMFEDVVVDTVTCIEVGFEAEELIGAGEWAFDHEANVNRTFAYSYDFGDGSTSNLSPLAVNHTYASNGMYNVCMTMTDGYTCQSTFCDSIEVTNIQPPCEADFMAYQDSANPNTYYGSNNSQGTNLTYAWDFGDGSPISTDQYPSHQFANPGTYTICLTITGDGNCVDSMCQTITFTQKASVGYFFQIVPPGQTASINQLNPFANMTIYPNPSNGIIKLNTAVNISEYTVLDLNGRVIHSEQVAESAEVIFDLSNHEKGMYFVIVQDENGFSSNPQRIIIE